MSHKNNKKIKGSVLVVTLVIFGVIIVTSLSVTFAMLRQLKTSMLSSKTNIAFQNADEGIDRVMTVILKGAKTVDSSGNVTVGSVSDLLTGAGSGIVCTAGAPKRFRRTASGVVEYTVEMLDSDGNNVSCESSNSADITVVTQLKAVGNDNATGTQRVVGANITQKSKNVRFLLHMDLKDSSVPIVDSSRVHHSVSDVNSSVDIDNGAGNKSAYITPNYSSARFNGTNSWLTSNDVNNDWENMGNFTVDFWMRIPNDNGPATQTLFELNSTGGSEVVSLNYRQGSHNVYISLFGTACTDYAWSDFDTGDFHHFAVVRITDGTTRLYIDGTLRDPGGSCKNNTVVDIGRISVGRGNSNSNYFRGYIDEFRFFSDSYWSDDFDDRCPMTATAPEVCEPY